MSSPPDKSQIQPALVLQKPTTYQRIRQFSFTKPSLNEREHLFALFDYTPAQGQDNHLEFVRDDEFVLKVEESAHWWYVKLLSTGKKGLVPRTYVARMSDKEILPFLSLRATREKAENKLMDAKLESGSFIIRCPTEFDYSEALVISVKSISDHSGTTVPRYLITRDNGKFALVSNNNEERQFGSLNELVKYYTRYSIDELVQGLTYSVKLKKSMIDIAWEIDPNTELQMEKTTANELGDGFFGTVYKAMLDGRTVAVKTLKPGTMTTTQFMKEAYVARLFSHKNITKTIGVCSDTNNPLIVNEFLEGGDLRNYLKRKGSLLSNDDNRRIAEKIACGMAYLEKCRIVHRDLAARNILVGQTIEIIKLADFGLARSLDYSIYYKSNIDIFPHPWTAPEAFVFRDSEEDIEPGRSSSASDVWSFAVVLWEIYNKGATPYDGMSRSRLYFMLTKKDYRLDRPFSCNERIYSKMLECWSLNPSDRPTFTHLQTFLQN